MVASAGAGYQVVERDDLKFSAEVGVAYYREDRDVGMDDEYPAARIAYHLESMPNDNITFIQDVEFIPSLQDGSDIYVRKDSRLRLPLVEKMSTQFQWILDYDNSPATGLERVDNLFLVSVLWEF